MKKLSAVLCAVLFAIAVNAQEVAPIAAPALGLAPVPAKAEAVKTWISLIGDNTQIVGGFVAIANPQDNWKLTTSPVLGVQGNLYEWKLRINVLTLQTTVKPGLVYLYATSADAHLIGVGVCGSLTKLPRVLSDVKEGSGLISKLPGNLSSIDWYLSIGSQADAVRPFISGGLSLKW